MDVSFSSSVSGMQTASTRHDITAHDVANINTQGFEESRADQVELSPEGTEIAQISRRENNPTEPSNTDLAEESREQIENKNSLAANAQAMKVQDQMLGEVIDLVG